MSIVIDPSNAACAVFTEKDGALSALAHDLAIAVTRFSVELDGDRVRGAFDAGSLEVTGVMRRGRLDTGELSAKHQREIEDNIRKDVLKTRRWDEISFVGTVAQGDPPRFEGELTLCGRTRPIRAKVSRDDDMWAVEVELHQPDFGIKPYTAMLGTLKIKPRVTVVLSFPAALLEG